jgi:UDP-galactopyranose mutase
MTKKNRNLRHPGAGFPPVVVVGAGPAGLSAAWHLGHDALLIERNDQVGGWCRSIVADGFTFDWAGHILFSKDPYVHAMYEMLLGDNLHWQDREAWIYSKGVHTRYPFQGSLYGLPQEVIQECLAGVLEAHAHHGTRQPRNFEEFIYQVWGAGIARHFAIPYNRKLWATDLKEMETSWLGGRVPLPDVQEMIDGAQHPSPKPMGPNARFGYPLRGGIQALMDGFLPHLRGPLWLGRTVVAVSPARHTITLDDGRTVPYQRLISTMPLPVLIEAVGQEAPWNIRMAARSLRHVSVRCVHVGVGREEITDKHWIYYPEDTVFHRIFVQGNASPYCNPPGGFGLTCEITYSPEKPLPCDGQSLVDLAVADCRRVGIVGADDPILTAFQVDMPHAYVVYDHARPARVATIQQWLEAQDIIVAGRYGQWEYFNSDHALLAGKQAAELCRQERMRTAA